MLSVHVKVERGGGGASQKYTLSLLFLCVFPLGHQSCDIREL